MSVALVFSKHPKRSWNFFFIEPIWLIDLVKRKTCLSYLYISLIDKNFSKWTVSFSVECLNGRGVTHNYIPSIIRFDNPACRQLHPDQAADLQLPPASKRLAAAQPLELCCDWTMALFLLWSPCWTPRNLATVVFYAMLSLMAYHSLWYGHSSAKIVPDGTLVGGAYGKSDYSN